jgi:hypothetical protein
MVDTKTKVNIADKQTERNDPREKLREARARRLKLIAGDRPTTVKVYASR